MICPRCFQANTSPVGQTHYVCNNKDCVDDNGNRTQFSVVPDEEIAFPYSQIFAKHSPDEFYRKPYVKIKPVGETEL